MCIIALWLLALTGAEAAQIAVKPLDNGPTMVVVEGELDLADIESFRIKTESLPIGRATVEFNSKGGSLLAGIRIGSLIRNRKFTTFVPDGAQCASACALAWLGGTRRFVGEYASVGFHTAYIVKTGGLAESGPGNAILGAYLNQLGLSEKAIIYITHAAPTSMQWMSMEEAAEYGITVVKLSPAHADPGPAGEAVAQHPEGSQERRAIEFVLALLERWSGPNAELLQVLNELYTDKVLYYGKPESRQTVLLTKRRFANRWTQRAYTVRPSSLTATCGGTMCQVKGTMSFKFHAPKTASHGVASFEYNIVLNDAGTKIVAETSSVKEEPPAASSSSSLGQVGRSIQQLLARLSKPATTPTKPPAKALPKASTQAPTQAAAKASTQAAPKAPTQAAPKAPTQAAPKTTTQAAPKASTQASIKPKAPVAR